MYATDKILCPWHREETPSCHVYSDGYKCFGCGKAGPLSDLPEGEYHASAEKAPKYVEDVASSIAKIQTYPRCTIRGLSLYDTTDSYYLVWPEGQYYIRRYKESVAGKSKYKCPAGVPRPLYVARHAPDRNILVIVEGELNAASIGLACGDISVVSPGSAGDFYSAGGRGHLGYYRAYPSIYLLVDKDAAGAAAAIELKSLLMKTNPATYIHLMEQDANDILVQHGKEKLKETIEGILEVPGRVRSGAESVQAPGEATSKYGTGA